MIGLKLCAYQQFSKLAMLMIKYCYSDLSEIGQNDFIFFVEEAENEEEKMLSTG